MAIQWAQGFIAGHNIYTNASPPSSNAVPSKPAVLIPLLDSYCEAPPQSPLVAALINITKNLGGSKMTVVPQSKPEEKPKAPLNTPGPRRESQASNSDMAARRLTPASDLYDFHLAGTR